MARPRRSRQGHFYVPKENQKPLLCSIKRQTSCLNEPLILDVYIAFDCQGFPVAPSFGDEDNLRKSVADALVHAGYVANDRWILGGETYKFGADRDFLVAKIWRVFNERGQ
jgi:Holliday junction resolvase RusA-like endonuclease